MDLSNVPEHTKAALIAANKGKPLAEMENAPEAILTRYERGEKIEQIADSLDISPPAIYRFLARNAEEKWKEYQAATALHEYQVAEDELRTAADSVTVSRARELVKSAQWKLERVLRRVYGQEVPTINVQVNIGDVAGQIRELEGELLRNAALLQAKPETEGDSE